MPNQLSSGVLIASISEDMADNNAGLISAQDVRHNMEDTVYSIRKIVASGETESTFTFYNPIVASTGTVGVAGPVAGATSGDIIVESGFTKEGKDKQRQGV